MPDRPSLQLAPACDQRVAGDEPDDGADLRTAADLQSAIEALWLRRDSLTAADDAAWRLVRRVLDLLDSGAARVAEPEAGRWVVHHG